METKKENNENKKRTTVNAAMVCTPRNKTTVLADTNVLPEKFENSSMSVRPHILLQHVSGNQSNGFSSRGPVNSLLD